MGKSPDGYKDVWRGRAGLAYGYLAGWIVVEAGCMLVPWASSGAVSGVYPLWLILIALTAFALRMHAADTAKAPVGVRGLMKRRTESENGLQPSGGSGAVGGILARKAIHAAMAFFALVEFAESRRIVVESFDPMQWLSQPVGDGSQGLVAAIIFALGFSVLAMLVSALCYDTSFRVEWRECETGALTEIEKHLLYKGAKLEEWAWYSMLWGMIGICGLANRWLGYLAAFVVFILHWIYYTIPKGLTFSGAQARPPEEPKTAV